jgi:hypothetical protein
LGGAIKLLLQVTSRYFGQRPIANVAAAVGNQRFADSTFGNISASIGTAAVVIWQGHRTFQRMALAKEGSSNKGQKGTKNICFHVFIIGMQIFISRDIPHHARVNTHHVSFLHITKKAGSFPAFSLVFGACPSIDRAYC